MRLASAVFSRSPGPSPSALPAGVTYRSDGRGVDADAGQGDALLVSNHLTPGVLTGHLVNIE